MYTLIMASIQRYTVKGKSYWRVVESRRVNGKPRAIPVLHLGTAEALLRKLSQTPKLRIKSFEHGTVAALFTLGQELGISSIIDEYTEDTRRKSSVGDSLLLIAINRLVAPCSKRGLADWVKRTSLFRFVPELTSKKLSSQFFWDQMQALPVSAIPKIEQAITRAAVEQYQFSLDTLFFDTTNCYTYIDHDNKAADLAKCGHSKERQYHRRLFGVALMTSQEGVVPLCHAVFPGNMHDSKHFPSALETLCKRLEAIDHPPTSVTLVFDRGINSRANFESIVKRKLHFVAALRIGDTALTNFSIPLRQFKKTLVREGKALHTYRSTLELYGQKYTSILYVNNHTREEQARALDLQLSKKLQELHEWKLTIENHTTRLYDDTRIKRKISHILSGPYIKEVLSISYTISTKGLVSLKFGVDEEARARLIQSTFGRYLLITTRHNWSTAQILHTYFQQSLVERSFRELKDDSSIAIRPQFHWTDHSITIHVFTCYLALLLGRLLLLKAKPVKEFPSIRSLLDELQDIRLVSALTLEKTKQKSVPKPDWSLEHVPKEAIRLFKRLAPDSC